MKKLITLAVALLTASFSAFAQDTIKDTKAPNEEIFYYVEQMPEAGFDLPQFLKTNIQYPKIALDSSIQGRVVVKFIVNIDGQISDIVVTKSVHPALDAEAIRLVMAMPKWKPGKSNGKPVKTYFTLPIKFALQ